MISLGAIGGAIAGLAQKVGGAVKGGVGQLSQGVENLFARDPEKVAAKQAKKSAKKAVKAEQKAQRKLGRLERKMQRKQQKADRIAAKYGAMTNEIGQTVGMDGLPLPTVDKLKIWFEQNWQMVAGVVGGIVLLVLVLPKLLGKKKK